MKQTKNSKPVYDVVNDVLEECIMAYPVSSFIISLYKQYGERGSLSKKQLQGLHAKASGIRDIAPNKLATLEALINKMPTREKTPASTGKPLFEKDEATGIMISAILDKHPSHKAVLFLGNKYNNNEPLTTTELGDLKRIYEFVQKKS